MMEIIQYGANPLCKITILEESYVFRAFGKVEGRNILAHGMESEARYMAIMMLWRASMPYSGGEATLPMTYLRCIPSDVILKASEEYIAFIQSSPVLEHIRRS